VALSSDGDTLAVGARWECSPAVGIGGDQYSELASESGAVYVFTRSGGAWRQQAYVKASNTGAGDDFGAALALSSDGNTLAVGASDEASAAEGIDGEQGDDSAPQAGAVYVFSRSGDAWSQRAYAKATNAGAGDDFGDAVAVSGDGDTLAVGAICESSAAAGVGGDPLNDMASRSGAVYLF
jgi:hypothetical protein